jgi:hypothetical protein
MALRSPRDLVCVQTLFTTFFEPYFVTIEAVSPPVEVALTAITAAVAMHAGHMSASPRPDGIHRERPASARLRIPSLMCVHPFPTPVRCSS